MELLKVEGLDVRFRGNDGMEAHALRGLDLGVGAGEIRGLVGESGSGKTVASLSILRLLPTPAGRVEGGRILFQGTDLLALEAEAMRRIRGRRIAMVFQEPSRYLNPAFRVEEQIVEMLKLHLGLDKDEARSRCAELLQRVGLKDFRRVRRCFPHELSGGMKQRAMIAMAISCGPDLLIADEPTTALDVTLQIQILKLIRKLQEELGMGVLFISHDLGLIRAVADAVAVIYSGLVVESAPKAVLFRHPLHPYTHLLLDSIPSARKRGKKLRTIAGRVPDAGHIPPGCAFHPRCPLAEEVCRLKIPDSFEHEPGHKAACHMIGKKWLD